MVIPRSQRGYVFYCPNHSTRIVESGNAKFIEDGFVSGSSNGDKISEIKEINEPRKENEHVNVNPCVQIPIVAVQHRNVVEDEPINENVEPPLDINEQPLNENVEPLNINEEIIQEEVVPSPEITQVRRSTRERRSAISDDYHVYLQESEIDSSIDDPPTYKKTLESSEDEKWFDAMKEELDSMAENEVWDLVPLPHGFKSIGCK